MNTHIDAQNSENTTTTLQVHTFLRELVASRLEKMASEIDISTGFFELGLDSKMAMELVRALEEKVNHELYPTLLFEYQNIEDLSEYLLENDGEVFTGDTSQQDSRGTDQVEENSITHMTPDSVETTVKEVEKVSEETFAIATEEIEEEDIWGDSDFFKKEAPAVPVPGKSVAIVGLSMQYPGIDGTEALCDWLNANKENKGENKFVEFDTHFFNASSQTTGNLDPQAGVFLEESWRAIEDAGYAPRKLSSKYKVGVYAGVFCSDPAKDENATASFGNVFNGSVANATSYHLGLEGPSITLDARSSSPLAAVHLAVESIQNGVCDMALAGGISWKAYKSDEKQSSDHIENISPGSTPGEGVGIVLLKRLTQAEKDKDHIYAVIKGSAMNFGKEARNSKSDNPRFKVINDAMKQANVQPQAYGVMAAFGSDIFKRDSSGMEALKNIFSEKQQGQRCVLNRSESQYGASDEMAGLAKILLQFRHKQLIPDSNIPGNDGYDNFEHPSLKIQKEIANWETVASVNRFAGLTSFGKGGSNIHLVLEEYAKSYQNYQGESPALVILSAENKDRLKQLVFNLHTHIIRNPELDIYNIAYTLQTGREAMVERLVIPAANTDELSEKLKAYLAGELTGMMTGNIEKENTDFILKGHAGKAYIETALREKETDSLAQLWVKGVSFNWNLLYSENHTPVKTSLPSYPFARKNKELSVVNRPNNSKQPEEQLNPGLQVYSTRWEEVKASKTTNPGSGNQLIILAGKASDFEVPLAEAAIGEVISIRETDEITFYGRVQQMVQLKLKAKEPTHITVVFDEKEQQIFGFINGLIKTAGIESRKITGKTIAISNISERSNQWILDMLSTEENQDTSEVYYSGNNRKERKIFRLDKKAHHISGIKEHGVYLITGGGGGLGRLFAEALSKNHTIKFILTGRRSESGMDEDMLKRLQAEYYACDVTNKESVEKLINHILTKHGKLNGIIHAAGVLQDNFLINKTQEESRMVLKPKIHGTRNLDLATEELELDFVMYFSSMAGVTGNLGQADYASANKWMDLYAGIRNNLKIQGKRKGHTISINWPLWKEGGMKMEREMIERITTQSGMMPLPTEAGITAFHNLLQNNAEQGIVCYGDMNKISSVLIREDQNEVTAEKNPIDTDETYKRLELPSVEAIENRKKVPLSFAQQRLWFLSEMGQSNRYHIPSVTRIMGNLDTAALDKSIDYLIKRHEILRTTFDKDKTGSVYQHIHDTLEVEILREDYSSLPAEEKKNSVQERCIAFVNEEFDLLHGPLLRVILIKESDDSHVFGICMHHIISDAWSMNVLIGELEHVYSSFVTDQPITLPPLTIQYVDYAMWERSLFSSTAYKKHLNHWVNHLKGYENLAVITDFPRPKISSGSGGRVMLTMPDDIRKKLAAYSNQCGGTFFMGLLTSIYIVLNKYSRQSDICIGIPVANRAHADLEALIGFFVNTLVNRIRLDDRESLRAIFKKVNAELIRSQKYQQVPFDSVAELLKPEREMNRTPIFQVMVNYITLDEKLKFGTRSELVEGLDSNTSKFDLTFEFIDKKGEELLLSVEYNTDIYKEQTVQKITESVMKVIEDFPEHGETTLSAYSLVSSADKEQILVNFNQTQTAYPNNATIQELFERQVLKTPQKTALVFGGEQLTFEELEKRSRDLAVYLQKRGVRAETLVGICMDRSVEMIIGILGVLRAGGAYVPLDPTYPLHRIEYMIEDSIITGNSEQNAKLIITQDALQPILGPITQNNAIELLLLNAEGHINNQSLTTDGELEYFGKPEDLAYVIYTSGSTGKPKGVMVTHRNVVRLVKNTNYHQFSTDDILLATGAFSFDATIFEFFGMLLNGGELVLASQEVLLNSRKLTELIKVTNVNLMWFTSSWLNQLVESEIELFATLKKVITGGERLSFVHIDKLRRAYDHLEILNAYGPTENTTFSLTHKVQDVQSEIPIGKPISNGSVFVLDKQNNVQPVGVSGELCLSGDGLARGYLNRAELTREKFIENPFGPGKLYKTGDLARWLPDGTIDFLGRMDHQVKLRGFRIELGEIESLLNTYPGIGGSAVIVKEHAGNKQLVGYFITENNQSPRVEDIKGYLAKELPEYMIPAFLVEIDVIPLTPNGKTDRKDLTMRDLEVMSTKEFEDPKTDTEKQLASIWEEILEVPKVGLRDNFFELGGHSLLITKLLSRIQVQFGFSFHISKVFEAPVLKNMAEILDRSVPEDTLPNKSELPPKVIPLSSAQQRLWFLGELGQGDRYHIPGVLRIYGKLDIETFRKSFSCLVKRHAALRTTFRKFKEEVYQHIEEEVEVPMVYKDYSKFLNDKETKAEKICEEFIHTPFDLQQGPLIRYMIIKLSDQEYLLSICMHHIISDGWSLGIINKELSMAYDAFSLGKTPDLPALPLTYTDYTVDQITLFKSKRFKEGLNYWKSHLTNYKNLELPIDKPRPKTSSGNGHRMMLDLGTETKNKLSRFSLESKGTLFTALLTSVYILLHKLSGQRDFCIGIPTANRGDVKVEGLVGFFVNTLASRIQIDGNETFRQLFHKVQQELMSNQEYQFIPFEKVVEEVQSDRDLSRTPIFQVMVNYIYLDESIALGDTRGTLEEIRYNTSKFDLSFDFSNDHEGGLKLYIEYNTDIYNKTTIAQLMVRLQNIIVSLCEQADTSLKTFSILTGEERQQLLTDFNKTDSAYEEHRLIHELFEAQAAKTPERLALVFEETRLSYKNLNEESNRLAHFLTKKHKIKAGDLVAVKMERSEHLLIALLAVLKTGAAYVPIDVKYPDERIAYLETDSKSKLIIDSNTYAVFAGQSKKFSPENLLKPLKSDALAYVIYTSGTTGNPKGVMISHKNAHAMIHWAQSEFSTDNFETVFAATSHCFDLSVYELFYSLSIGKSIRLLKDALDIEKYLDIDRKILINTVPSSMRSLLESNSNLDNVRMINLAGEPFPVDIAQKLQEKSIEVRNLYGPSEDTTYSTYYKLSKNKVYATSIPIGQPILNTQVYILDDALQLVPVGTPGRLFVAGHGVTQGYLHKPELTSERFILDPFGNSGYMYDTGDLAKWSPDGILEYLGRKDNQVKIRGFRIELSEIETRLNDHPGILESAVVVKTNQDDQQLIAYCSVADTMPIDPQEVKSFLQRSLPEYMIPSFVIALSEIPLTPNGKIDRKALEKLDIDMPDRKEYVAPQTAEQKKLAEIWKEVLGLDTLGIHDNFFEMGGHSLMVTRLVSRVDKEFGIPISVSEVFDAATIQKMTNTILNKRNPEANTVEETVIPDHLILFEKNTSTDEHRVDTFILPGMPGLVDGYHELAKSVSKTSNRVFGIRMLGTLDREKPAYSIREMALHNLNQIQKVSSGKVRLLAHSYGGQVVYEMLKNWPEQTVEIEHVILIDSYASKLNFKVREKLQGFLLVAPEVFNVTVTENEATDMAKKLIRKPIKNREDLLYDFLMQKGVDIDRSLFSRLYALYGAAVECKAILDKKLDCEITLIKSNRNFSGKENLGWSPYYRSIRAVESPGNHFEVVKNPHVDTWTNELFSPTTLSY